MAVLSGVDEHETRCEREQREITEIAHVLLREKPPGTTVTDIWSEALAIWRTQFFPEVMRAGEDLTSGVP